MSNKNNISGFLQRAVLLGLLFGVTGVLGGCAAGGVSSKSADEIARMSDADICYLSRYAPVGFVPLEHEKRRLNCSEPRFEYAILDAQADKENPTRLSTMRVPTDLLRTNQCRGMRVTEIRPVPPAVTNMGILGIVKTSEPFDYFEVLNSTSQTQFVHLLATYSTNIAAKNMLIKVSPHGKTTFKIFGLNTPPSDLKLVACRGF